MLTRLIKLVALSAALAVALALSAPDRSALAVSDKATDSDATYIAPSEQNKDKAWYDKIPWEWGGHIKFKGNMSWPDKDSVFDSVGLGTYFDGDWELRVNFRYNFSDWAYFQCDYEGVYLGGDTRRKQFHLARQYPYLFYDGLLYGEPINDDRRLLSMAGIINDDDSYTLYHHIDRLALTLQPSWATIRLGRQVITWGNGLVFNPMDLFNPYAPTDIERDYKIGDDMAFVELAPTDNSQVQLIYVPRRNPISGEVEFAYSSVGGMANIQLNQFGLTFMAAEHYEDFIVGLGLTGPIGGAAWRINALYTFLDDTTYNDNYVSLVANMDYSWSWFDWNWYGLVEYFYYGLGVDDNYTAASIDPDLLRRMDRGEIYTLGRHYAAASLSVQVHPLVTIYGTVIANLEDPSGSIQPRMIINLTQNLTTTIGGTIYYGDKGSEFGGYRQPGTDLYDRTPNEFFLWFSYYF